MDTAAFEPIDYIAFRELPSKNYPLFGANYPDRGTGHIYGFRIDYIREGWGLTTGDSYARFHATR